MSEAPARHEPARFDPSTPNVARMYDYYLGGKDNFAADREAAAMALKVAPESRVARGVRAFLRPYRPVPGRGRDPAVRRHRLRPAHPGQRARDRPGGRRPTPVSSTSTTTRW